MNSSVAMPYALLILDVTSFSKINESLGHMFGDNVLIQVADCIIANVRKADIVGRLGGDEFIIFMKNISTNGALAQCEKIRKDIQSIYVGNNVDLDVCVGGIASCDPKAHFQDLLQTADNALYSLLVKECEGGVNVLSEIVEYQGEKSLSAIYDRQYITSLESKEKRLSEIIFELLEEAKDTEKAIQAVLALVGDKRNLSRIDVYACTDQKYIPTYKWVARECESLGQIDFDKLAEYRNNSKKAYPEKGMGNLECSMVSSVDGLIPEGISSILYCDMIEYGQVSGLIAYMCKEPRAWDFKDYKALKTVTRLISAYTLKAKAIK